MKKEQEIPGLVLYVTEHQCDGCPGDAFTTIGKIQLRAEVQDLEIWDQVVEKLHGMTIYTVDSLHEQVARAAQRRANRAEEQAMQVSEEARQQVDELESRCSFLEQEVNNLRGHISILLQERDELNLVIEAQDAALGEK